MNSLRPLEIAHIDTAMDLRGGQQQLLLLARGLRQRGHRQVIVCPEGSSLEAQARRQALPSFPLPAHDPGHVHGMLQLRQFWQAEPPHIVHAHDGRGQTIAWLSSASMHPIRRVASRRVTFLPPRRFWHRLKYTRTCHGIVAISRYVRQALVNFGVPETMIEVIPDGVDLGNEVPTLESRCGARAKWKLADQEFVVGHVGAFAAEKGQDIAIEAATILAEKLPHLRLLLVGNGGANRTRLFGEKVKKARGRVRLLGYLDNLSDFFAALDLFIMPSRAEGLGSSVLLAMAHGLAVVASRVGGVPEIVEEGKTGWLVPPDSAQALADAIAVAASNGERLRQWGAVARERAAQFSSDIMVGRTERFYYRLLGYSA